MLMMSFVFVKNLPSGLCFFISITVYSSDNIMILIARRPFRRGSLILGWAHCASRTVSTPFSNLASDDLA